MKKIQRKELCVDLDFQTVSPTAGFHHDSLQTSLPFAFLWSGNVAVKTSPVSFHHLCWRWLNSIQLNLNHDLDNLNKWLISNKLTLNSAKTEFMLIGSRQKLSTLSNPLKLSIDNVALEHFSSFKSLGIFIDENLRWQTHFDKLSKKVASGIGAIKRMRPFVPPPTLHCIGAPRTPKARARGAP